VERKRHVTEGACGRYASEMRGSLQTRALARRLRGNMTPPEVALWVRLRRFGREGPKFRRQHPIGPYVLDFYCPAAKLAVEVDGFVHDTADHPQRDERRDAYLRSKGIEVIRVPAADILRDPDATAESILGLWR
jgi:very-short-patch-repair endonuclease